MQSAFSNHLFFVGCASVWEPRGPESAQEALPTSHDVGRPRSSKAPPTELSNADLFLHSSQLCPTGEPEECASSASYASLTVANGADYVIDYVFVDEHNRHKRLKGKIL
jgi:hypothetical protein